MLMAAQLPVMLWGEALQYSVWIRSQMPTSALPDAKTPHEMATGERPDLGKAMEWGRKVFVCILDAGKLQPRAEEGRFIGFDWESKGVRIFWPKKQSVSIERDVYINKDEALVPGNDQNEEEMVIFDEIRENRHVQTIPEAPNVEAITPKANEPREDDGAAETTLNEPKTTKNEPVLPKIPPKLEITPPTPPTNPSQNQGKMLRTSQRVHYVEIKPPTTA
ncbi:hypothetical protein PLEOSDRAFT_1106055 [Pleurotus ostreatus PC15]|uniref:Retroviral polymerase SH3-like domain-containing protein n=1 Tax=Pleurotus ostreatus (strain PC15) TaxID=1137138 RepID=A0A067NU83_PLEO1|nr:hypothetical protein PLEOSDRAFT_1106055 [Pleurotus ostreatus PC15]